MHYHKLCLWTILLVGAHASRGSAQQFDSRQIALIKDTAVSICDTVKDTKGQRTELQLQGEVRGQLNGLVGRLASAKGSAGGSLTRDQFDGLTQDATAIALIGDRECRERLFNKMFDKLTASTFNPNDGASASSKTKMADHPVAVTKSELGPGAPPLSFKDPTAHPRLSPMDLQREVDGFTFEMSGCAHIGADAVQCSFTVTNSEADRVLSIFDWSGGNFILDSHGIMHGARTAELGASHGHPATTYVASGVPVNGSVTYGGDGRTIEGIARLSLGVVVDETNGNAPPFKIKWSDLPLDAVAH